jgi:hypothetical protein
MLERNVSDLKDFDIDLLFAVSLSAVVEAGVIECRRGNLARNRAFRSPTAIHALAEGVECETGRTQ